MFRRIGSSFLKHWAMKGIVFVLLLAWVSVAQARPLAPDSPDRVSGTGDDGKLEVGVEWMNHFPNPADDRSHWDESCDGLYNQLLSDGWQSVFHWTDYNAWETDFKRAALGGNENTIADSADIAMICTHGAGEYDTFWNKNLSSVYFGSSHSDHHLSPGDAYRSFGDSDLEWLAFDSCSVLSDGGPAPYFNRGYWAATMDGLHLLLGFKNTMYVWAPGDGLLWGFYMKGFKFGSIYLMPPFSVTQAWFQAVDYVQPSVTCARILAETPDNFNDHLWGKGYVSLDPAVDGTYWYWDHCSTKTVQTTAQSVPAEQQAVSMPIIQVVPRQVDRDYLVNRVAPAFNMTGTIGMDDMFYFMINTEGGITHTLQVDLINGGFNYKNLSELWTTPVLTPTLLSLERSSSLVQQFFSQSGEGLPGVWSNLNSGLEDFTVEEIVGIQSAVPAGGLAVEQELARIPADASLTYGRKINTLVQTRSGLVQQEFPVVGAGGRLKVYLGDQGKILGMQGGSRDLTELPEVVEVMDAVQAWELFRADPGIALPQVPWVADVITPTSQVLGYYEAPLLEKVNELVPVWIFTADFSNQGQLLASGVQVNVPASTSYLPPQPVILSPADGGLVNPNQEVILAGDVLANGKPPFSFEWWSNQDGFLGSGPNLPVVLSPSGKAGQLNETTIELKVTDANGLTGTAQIQLMVKMGLYLPQIQYPTSAR